MRKIPRRDPLRLFAPRRDGIPRPPPRRLNTQEYDEIEPEKVFEAIRAALADLPVYLQAVVSFIG